MYVIPGCVTLSVSVVLWGLYFNFRGLNTHIFALRCDQHTFLILCQCFDLVCLKKKQESQDEILKVRRKHFLFLMCFRKS